MSERDSEVIPAHVARRADAAIRRAYLAVDLGLDVGAFQLPDDALAAFGLPPRGSAEHEARFGERTRIEVRRSVREVDATCSVCGEVTHYERIGDGKAFVPPACPKHLRRPLTSWRAA